MIYKNTPSLIKSLVLVLLTSSISFAQKKESTKATKNYHLHKINYMSSNVRFGYGLESSKLAISNDWKYTGGSATFMGGGFNYVIKNSLGFDIQFNYTKSKFSYENIGPNFKTGLHSSHKRNF
jgi:hypothetical protein